MLLTVSRRQKKCVCWERTHPCVLSAKARKIMRQSKEQLRGEKADERSDLFATGVIIYECLHGEKPFAGRTYLEITQSMSEEIEFAKNEPFAKFFERSLAQKPEKRFTSATEMKKNLTN